MLDKSAETFQIELQNNGVYIITISTKKYILCDKTSISHFCALQLTFCHTEIGNMNKIIY